MIKVIVENESVPRAKKPRYPYLARGKYNIHQSKIYLVEKRGHGRPLTDFSGNLSDDTSGAIGEEFLTPIGKGTMVVLTVI